MNQSTSVLNIEENKETLTIEPEQNEMSLEHAVDLAEKQVEILERVLAIALRRTSEEDWVNQNGKPYLMSNGADKLMPVFGICLKELKREKIMSSDDIGNYYIYEYSAEFSWKGSSIIAIGTSSQRSRFFAWISKEKRYKKSSEINETNIMKSAYTNLNVNGVTRLLGIRNLTWETLKKFGIDKDKVGKIEYKSPSQDSPEEEKQRVEISAMLLEMCNSDPSMASENLQALTSFQGKDGNMVSGVKSTKQLKGKRLEITHSKTLKAYKEFQSGVNNAK
jgi:hypothetical protein